MSIVNIIKPNCKTTEKISISLNLFNHVANCNFNNKGFLSLACSSVTVCDAVRSSQPDCTGHVCASKPVYTSLVRSSRPVCASNVDSSKPVCTSNYDSSKPVCSINIKTSKLVCTSHVCPIKPACAMCK